MTITEVPILVVGAGPAGLTTAITLARHGIESLVVDRRPVGSALPRATTVSTRTMELMRAWGLEEAVRAGGHDDVEWVGWSCETLAGAAAGIPFHAGYPTREQSAAVSPVAPAAVPQDHLEPTLLAHLRSLGAGRVEVGAELVDVEAGPHGARAWLRDVATGRTRIVDARYVVGADGVRSRARERLGIPWRGPERLADGVSVLFRAPLWELAGRHRYGIYDLAHPDGAGILLPAGHGDRWIYATNHTPGDDPGRPFSRAELEARIRAAAGRSSLPLRVERSGRTTYGAQLAGTFRHESAFLVGDAAHRVSPRGGTGMNTAIRGGHDLGWKLAWVLNGWAGDGLLDTYEGEHRPHAEHNVARSARPDGSLADITHGLHADLGGRLTHVWLPAPADRVSTLDLLGRGLTLFTGPDRERWAVAADQVAAGAPPIDLRPLAGPTARALGLRPGGALLARPDGVPAGLWGGEAEPVEALRPAAGAFAAPEQPAGAR